VSDIRALGGQADYLPEVTAIIKYIAKNNRGHDVVLVMSSGGFSGIHQKLLEAL
jgi:UDP-N-acetylmuramate-alanine ligase